MRQKASVPAGVLKHPPIFWTSLIIRMSRSEPLLSKGTERSLMYLSTSSRFSRSRMTRAVAGFFDLIGFGIICRLALGCYGAGGSGGLSRAARPTIRS